MIVFFVWLTVEARRHGMRHPWICVLLACLFGLSGPFPLFLYMREKTLEEPDASFKGAR
jgi:hypothetical protein